MKLCAYILGFYYHVLDSVNSDCQVDAQFHFIQSLITFSQLGNQVLLLNGLMNVAYSKNAYTENRARCNCMFMYAFVYLH